MDTNDEHFYNQIYTDKPEKWANPYRDVFMYEALSPFISNPGSCIDLGCGNGHSLAYLREQWRDTKYYGIDVSRVAIEWAQEHHPGITFVTGYIGKSMPRCDIALCMGVMEHFMSLRPALYMMRLYGHLVYLEVPDNLRGGTDSGWRKSPGGQYEWHLDRPTWEQHIKEAGYTIRANLEGPSAASRFVWILDT